jgi:ABC-type transport system substrate-binding protein
MFAVAPDQIPIVQDMEEIAFQAVVGYTITHLSMRCDQLPFDDVNVRMAVDMDAIVANLSGVTGIRSPNTTVPPDMPGSASDILEPVPYDLDQVKALLAASSQLNGFSTQIHVIAPNDNYVPTVVAVQEALRELNIEAKAAQNPYADFTTLQQSGDWDGILHWQWGSDILDASGMLLPVYHSRNLPPRLHATPALVLGRLLPRATE